MFLVFEVEPYLPPAVTVANVVGLPSKEHASRIASRQECISKVGCSSLTWFHADSAEVNFAASDAMQNRLHQIQRPHAHSAREYANVSHIDAGPNLLLKCLL